MSLKHSLPQSPHSVHLVLTGNSHLCRSLLLPIARLPQGGFPNHARDRGRRGISRLGGLLSHRISAGGTFNLLRGSRSCRFYPGPSFARALAVSGRARTSGTHSHRGLSRPGCQSAHCARDAHRGAGPMAGTEASHNPGASDIGLPMASRRGAPRSTERVTMERTAVRTSFPVGMAIRYPGLLPRAGTIRARRARSC